MLYIFMSQFLHLKYTLKNHNPFTLSVLSRYLTISLICFINAGFQYFKVGKHDNNCVGKTALQKCIIIHVELKNNVVLILEYMI